MSFPFRRERPDFGELFGEFSFRGDGMTELPAVVGISIRRPEVLFQASTIFQQHRR